MKVLIAILALAAAALLVYNYVQTGRVTLIPSSVSKDEAALQRLEERLDGARRRFEAAGRAAGLTGVDTSADAEAARREVGRVEADLTALRERLADELRSRADQLRDRLQEFKKELH